jgi:hypothetical protein
MPRSVTYADNHLALETKYIFPTANVPGAEYVIDYEDFDEVLSKIILSVGPSEHIHAPNPRPRTATFITSANKKSSRLEANRIRYSSLSKDNIDYIGAIKKRLESIPDEISLEAMSKDTQLAYWLNLHNVTVMHEIAKQYPITDIEPLYIGLRECLGCEDIEPVLMNAKLNIGGDTFSIQDLRNHILSNWENPLVIYGLYMGYIGSPNIKNSAYKGALVWDQLEDNAEEFINSIRGTQLWGKRLRISGYYKLGLNFFPDFDRDIRRHLAKYGKRKVQRWLNKNPSITMSVYNWDITDLYNGRPYSSDNRTVSQDLLTRIQRKFNRQLRNSNPNVEIDEVDRGTSPPPEQDSDNNQPK